MTAAATTERPILLHRIDGKDESNTPDVTTIVVFEDSDGATPRYRVGRTRTGLNSGQPFDLEGFTTSDAAEQYAAELAERTRDQYRLEGQARREARKGALLDLVATWYRDDPAREAAEALAEAIGAGLEGKVLQALAAYDPMPERRAAHHRWSQRAMGAIAAPLDDQDVIAATGCAG